ncbi:MAG: MBL fold metallo-hydrolase [Pseudomonadota bacterium]
MDELRFTILGCGSSPGVPRIGNDWGACDPNNPKNERLRCALLVERISANGITRVLVDATPDLRTQMLRENIAFLDGVLITHPHADHIHGLDDLRGFWLKQRELIDVYADRSTSARLMEAFGYCFKTPEGSSYPPISTLHQIEAGKPVVIEGAGGPLTALPYVQHHGDIHSLGFRFENVAYSSDAVGLPEETLPYLQGLEIFVLDALRYKPHPSHYSLSEALEVAENLQVGKAILTHMHIDLDYDTLRTELPNWATPAYDGMRFSVEV